MRNARKSRKCNYAPLVAEQRDASDNHQHTQKQTMIKTTYVDHIADFHEPDDNDVALDEEEEEIIEVQCDPYQMNEKLQGTDRDEDGMGFVVLCCWRTPSDDRFLTRLAEMQTKLTTVVPNLLFLSSKAVTFQKGKQH